MLASVAEWLRHRVGTRKVPGSNPGVRTAYTCSHQPTQLSILWGLVNGYQGYSIWGTQGVGPHQLHQELPDPQPALTNKCGLLACIQHHLQPQSLPFFYMKQMSTFS